jgi:hypothetical protein
MLQFEKASSDAMTVESCVAIAQASGYSYVGLENGKECWVGNALLNPLTIAPPSSCNSPCGGDTTELCGGATRLSFYIKGGG